jgi:hypothetical protein
MIEERSRSLMLKLFGRTANSGTAPFRRQYSYEVTWSVPENEA